MKAQFTLILMAILFFSVDSVTAQGVAINDNGNPANSSAQLDVQSTTKGFLPPRMTEAQRDAISSPATGLIIYQTDGTTGLYHYNGSAWTVLQQAPGTAAGEMQYWNGSAWVAVAAGTEGQVLTFSSGVPTWKTQLEEGDVENPTTGKIWMDKNLGASQVATSSTDADAYGDLYQWGRAADGHESRTSGTTATLATSDTPGHSDFITNSTSPYDWRNGQNVDLWQGVSGTNNPCPSGYRLPTEAEWDAERLSWSSNNAAGAFASPLKLPLAGRRRYSSGELSLVGSSGYYWSSTVVGTNSARLNFYSSNASMSSYFRANAYSVRCLKD